MEANDTLSGTLKRKGGGHKKEEALAALLVHPTRKAAAESCGISLSSIQRWLREPAFAERYQQAKLELVSGTTTQLRANGVAAVETLKQVATNTENPPAARVSAARAILEFMFGAVELEDVLVRLDKLEQDRGDE